MLYEVILRGGKYERLCFDEKMISLLQISFLGVILFIITLYIVWSFIPYNIYKGAIYICDQKQKIER